MQTTSEVLLPIGTFVSVGDSLGIIVGLPGSPDVPEQHYAVWYGESSTTEVCPLCRTVPVEYCARVDKCNYYH